MWPLNILALAQRRVARFEVSTRCGVVAVKGWLLDWLGVEMPSQIAGCQDVKASPTLSVRNNAPY